jgi:nitroreductase
LLGATEKGLGGCIIASVQREALRKALGIDSHDKILLVLALGKPKETVVIDVVGPEGDIKYWRDGEQVHHVPKRGLQEIIVG